MNKSITDKILLIIVALTGLFVLSQCDLSTTNQDFKLREYPKHRMFLIEEANASNRLNFNLEPPEQNNWKLPSNPRMELIGNYNEYQRYWMQRAWEISGYDKEFMYMLASENGLFNADRQSEYINKKGIREPSWGFCQIHAGYHPHIVNDPRFLSDPEWQLHQCKKLWDGGTVFYGYVRQTKDVSYRKRIESQFNFYENLY